MKNQSLTLLTKVTLCILFISSYSEMFSQTSTDHFVTTWKTDNPGDSNDTSINITTSGSGLNFDVDWNNDGVFDDFGLTNNIMHDFGVAGTYTVRIRGFFRISFPQSSGDAEKLLSVEQWGNIVWPSMNNAFRGAKNLVFNATDVPDLSQVTVMDRMFIDATFFNSNINNWDVSNVTSMLRMFEGASSFNQPLDNWDVSNANIYRMFNDANSFNQNINSWDVSNLTDGRFLFKDCFDFNQPLDNWDVSNVTDMYQMFRNCSSFNQPLNNWNVSNVTDMTEMFEGATNFNGNISNWNTSSVTDLTRTFDSAVNFNQDIGNWNVSNVTSMLSTFFNAENFNQDLSNWNVSNVTTLSNMFQGADAFDRTLGNWDVSNVTNMSGIFSLNHQLSTENYDDILINWSTQSLQDLVPFTVGDSDYCNGQDARMSIIDNFGWFISDGEFDCSQLDIETFNKDEINIYPNPVTDIVNINTANQDNLTIDIYNINGRLIETYSNTKTIDLQNFISGIFILKLTSNEKVQFIRLIKK